MYLSHKCSDKACMRTPWPEPSLLTYIYIAGRSSKLYYYNGESDLTGLMFGYVRVFAWCIGHFVGLSCARA